MRNLPLSLLLLVATAEITFAQKQHVDVLIKSGSLIDMATGKRADLVLPDRSTAK